MGRVKKLLRLERTIWNHLIYIFLVCLVRSPGVYQWLNDWFVRQAKAYRTLRLTLGDVRDGRVCHAQIVSR